MRSAVLALVGSALVFVPLGAGGQTMPNPVPSAGPCSVRVNLWAVDAKRVALRFFTSGAPGPLSGTVALYAGDRRYDVPFRNAYAISDRDEGHADVVPVIVRFPAAIHVDAVIVTAVDAPAPPSCVPSATPYIEPKYDAVDAESERAERGRADSLIPIDAPAPITLPRSCRVRNVPGRVVSAAEPRTRSAGSGGVAYVAVSLDASDHVTGARIQTSSGDAEQDAVALDAARRSTYENAIFDCVKRPGTYVIGIGF
jgi:TonB family protein